MSLSHRKALDIVLQQLLSAPLITNRYVRKHPNCNQTEIELQRYLIWEFSPKLSFSMMVFISCNLELEAFMEYHMVLVYTGNQLQLWEDTDLGVLGFVLLVF